MKLSANPLPGHRGGDGGGRKAKAASALRKTLAPFASYHPNGRNRIRTTPNSGRVGSFKESFQRSHSPPFLTFRLIQATTQALTGSCVSKATRSAFFDDTPAAPGEELSAAAVPLHCEDLGARPGKAVALGNRPNEGTQTEAQKHMERLRHSQRRKYTETQKHT